MTEPLLHVDGLYRAFGALQATDGVTLTLMPGEIHALIGPNGAGKSTLIKQIAGGLMPDAGRVWFKGRDVTALSTQRGRKRGWGARSRFRRWRWRRQCCKTRCWVRWGGPDRSGGSCVR